MATKSMLGVTPRILCALGFSVKEVVTELNIIANRLRAIVVADCPDDAINDNLIGFVSDCAGERIYAVYPQVANTREYSYKYIYDNMR